MTDSLATYLFHEGTNFHSDQFLGAFLEQDGCTFRVWAPNAKNVFVTGEFCDWQTDCHPMKRMNDQGIFEVTVTGVQQFDSYKYIIETQDGRLLWKADPYAKHAETRPKTASKVYQFPAYQWRDAQWLQNRQIPEKAPMNIYEVHLGSWKHQKNGEAMTYRQLAHELVSYVKRMNYTHIELLPLTEYPYDKSWGYQVTGYFAATSRYGTPEDLMYFIDECHRHNIGVILDWVPGHFTKDEFGLYEFDGTCCYEYGDERKKEHKSWGTRVFDYGKGEVVSFLLSSANFWIEQFHVDGLRVDAVSSMLFLNYDRNPDEAAKNIYGGNENLEVLDFFRKLNQFVRDNHQGVMMIAEEATAYPKITSPIEEGGLGFHFKWNMGWMNDSLDYIEVDPFFRKGSHHKFTFSMCYAFVEQFILPISHDEVVHGKHSLLDKAPVAYEDKFASLKAFLGYMYAHPGKKLTFMGTDIAQFIEWDEERELDWFLLDYPIHRATHQYIRELNAIYQKTAAFWQRDRSWEGFRWHVVDDASNNLFGFSRIDEKGQEVLVICNLSGQTLKRYPIGVEANSHYQMLLNSDAKKFGGSGLVNRNIQSIAQPTGEFSETIYVNIAPFTTLYLVKK